MHRLEFVYSLPKVLRGQTTMVRRSRYTPLPLFTSTYDFPDNTISLYKRYLSCYGTPSLNACSGIPLLKLLNNVRSSMIDP